MTTKTWLGTAALMVALGMDVAASSPSSAKSPSSEEKSVAEHLAKFDDLDFNVFSGQNWEGFHKTHTKDVLVHWPDGHTTKGFDRHIEDMKAMFVYAPDTRVKIHPVKVGQGEWTAVIGIMEGTFTKPMPIGEGKTIPPTGKSFKLAMSTFAHWTKDGLFDEEYLFWDNQAFMKQLGIVQ